MPRRTLPKVEDLLSRKEYWTPEFFRIFVDHINATMFENPQEGVELALHAPRLAARVVSRTETPETVHLQAYAVLGSAYRAAGRYREAEEAFAQASLYGASLTDLENVDLWRRMALLRRDQRKFADAHELIESAIQSYRAQGDLTNLHFLGCCYLVRGQVHWENGNTSFSVIDLTEALNHIDLCQDPKVYYAAVHNLAVIVADCGDPGALGKALKLLNGAQRRLRYQRRHMAKYKLKWLQAMIAIRFGSTRYGERHLLVARDGLIELGAAYEVALTSLDLTSLYLLEGEPPGVVAQLAAETYQLFSSMSSDKEALAALLIWHEAAAQEALTEGIVRDVRETIARLTTPSM